MSAKAGALRPTREADAMPAWVEAFEAAALIAALLITGALGGILLAVSVA